MDSFQSTIFFIFLSFIYFTQIYGALNCQGSTSATALLNCPDQGAQQASSGGNVTILVQYATNMPNLDNSGPAAGVSDPYVKFTVGNVISSTHNIRNSLNPQWNENVNLGYLTSASLVTVEIWDRDTGLEFTDDLMLTGSFRIPFCSYFAANDSTVDCDEPFNCAADDSLWQMPTRKRCSTSGLINFGNAACGSDGAICLYFVVNIVPFVMEVELSYASNVLAAPALSVATTQVSSAIWTSTYKFGYPFLSSTLFIGTISAALKGALMFRTSSSEKSYGAANAIKYYIGTNFPATIYICRYQLDDQFGVPSWITNGYSADFLLARQFVVATSAQTFECYQQNYTGTVKNRWGGVEGGAIAMATNTLPGFDSNSNSDKNAYYFNYIILAVPYLSTTYDYIVNIVYDESVFVNFLGSYGLITFWFLFVVQRFLNRIDFRIDRFSAFAVTRVLTGEERSLIAALFLDFNKSPSNVQYRAHMYHVRNILFFLVTAPLWLLLSWGICCALKARPHHLGIGVAFGGMAFCLCWFAYRLWERSKWRLSSIAASCFLLAIFCYSLFLLICLFLEEGVLNHGYSIDFTALSLIFGTLNCLPCLLLIFKNDRSHKVFMQLVFEKIRDGIMKQQQVSSSKQASSSPSPGDLQVNKTIHQLLGEAYTINPKIPALKYGGVLSEVPRSYHNVHLKDAESNSSNSQAAVDEEEQELQNDEQRLYGGSLFLLFLYLMIAIARTDQASLAFLNICALMLLDFIHLSMSKGESSWSPGFKVLLLVKGRILICGSPASLWMLNYSACYLLYAVILLYEVIDQLLPKISKRKAGAVVFGPNDQDQLTAVQDALRTHDLSGSALFCLGVLIVSFAAILVIGIYMPHGSSAAARSELQMPNLDVLGLNDWQIYVFGVIAFFVSVIAGLAMATYRAVQLDSFGLLKGWAKDIYFYREQIKLPIILAAGTELSILLTGLTIYAVTGADAVLVGCIFLPVIFFCFGRALLVWIKNDYDLVIWPRPLQPVTAFEGHMKAKKLMDDQDNELDAAFKMIGSLFNDQPKQGADPFQASSSLTTVQNFEDGNDLEAPETGDATASDIMPVERTLQGFTLPPLKAMGATAPAEVKMPPLPLKSVLRRKRQNLGIKTQGVVPLVQDLRARDSAVESDQFGNRQEVADIGDPWQQFELQEPKKKKKGIVMSTQKVETTSYLKLVNTFLRTNKTIGKLKKSIWQCISYFRRQTKVYPTIYRPSDEDEEETAADGEGGREGGDVEQGEEGGMQQQGADGGKEEDGKKQKKDDDDGEALVELDEAEIRKLPFWDAFWGGYLNGQEYRAICDWYLGMFFVMLFGIALGKIVRPAYLGYVVWVSCWLFVLAVLPMVKYFHVYKFDDSSRSMLRFALFLLFMFCVTFFGAYLNGSIQVAGTLWLLDLFFYYPIISYVFFITFEWIDSGFKSTLPPLVERGREGQFACKDILYYLTTFPALMVAMIALNWQFYVWLNYTAGTCFSLLLITIGLAYFFLKDWAANDYFLSPELSLLGNYLMLLSMFISFCVALFETTNPIFAWSVFFFLWAFRSTAKVVSRILLLPPGTYFYFSPYLMPVYSYNGSAKDLFDESEFVGDILVVYTVAVLWGGAMTIFFYPIHIGVVLSCGFMLLPFSTTALCVSYIPRQLAKANNLILPEFVAEAAMAAQLKFKDRRLPLNFEMKQYDSQLPEEVLVQEANAKTLLDQLKDKTCLENAVALLADLRFTKYVKEDLAAKAAAAVDEEEKDEYELLWYQKLAVQFRKYLQDLYELLPINQEIGFQKHDQTPFNLRDGCNEVFFRGGGPFGLLGVGGMIYSYLITFKDSQYFRWLYPAWTENYNEWGVKKSLVQLADPIDYTQIFTRIKYLDTAVDFTFFEEARCAIHFLMTILVSADAKLERETVLFQKFLRENRYRLASNGITPPKEIFTSSSYSSINIPLTAIWLNTLSKEERERFYLLKQTFNAEQMDRDAEIDRVDNEISEEAKEHERLLLSRDAEWMERLSLDLAKLREQTIQSFVDSLDGAEKQRFLPKKDLWGSDPACFVDVKDNDLYERFVAACMDGERNDLFENTVRGLVDCEAAQRDIRLGEYGRQYQFVDSEFLPSEMSIGDCDGLSSVLGWRCAPGIVEGGTLFEGGTHPDDVCEGVFKDSWLLSAICMLVGASGFGTGLVNEQIKGLFVPHPSSVDGSLTIDTEVGAYCIKIYRNGDWIPVIMDDLLPMRQKEYWTNENRGVAAAHVKECRGLWVSLIEKAFAKYYGSYSRLEKGFVHHALQDLTGCEVECLSLSSFARGVNKLALWDRLQGFKRNGYILGCGTGAAHLVDTEILEMGVCFDAAYVIYDVRQVDGYKLIKLRNPPGDHEEWRGDWSDRSPLWTKRLKHKAGYRDDLRDNTFFISFDDFLNVFRYLYVCKYYNPKKWIEVKHPGLWKKADEAAVEQMDLINKFLIEQGEVSAERHAMDMEELNRKKAKARLDSAGGLPSRHNPGCILENNPHYSLRIFRPTDLKITVTQYQAKGIRSMLQPKPFSVIVVKNPHPTIPQRLTSIKKEDVLFTTGEPRSSKSISLYINGIGAGFYSVIVGTYLSAWMLKDKLKAGEVGNIDSRSDKMKQRLLKGSKNAKQGFETVGNAARKGLKALFGNSVGGDNYESDDDDEEKRKGNEEEEDEA